MDKLLPAGRTAVRSAVGQILQRPFYEAGGDGGSGYAWLDGSGSSWTVTASGGTTHERGSAGARAVLASSTVADNAVLLYSGQVGPTRVQNGDGQRGRGASGFQIFEPSGNTKNVVVGARASASAPDGTEVTESWGVSRLNGTDPTNWYAYARGAGATKRLALGTFVNNHVMGLHWEIVGTGIEIALFDFNDGQWIGGKRRFAASTVASAATTLFYTATTTGTSAVALACGKTTIHPSYWAI